MSITKVATSHASSGAGQNVGEVLSGLLLEKLGGDKPDVVIVFASPDLDLPALLSSIDAACTPGVMVGCSSSGEFSGCATNSGSVSAMAIRSDDILFNAGLGKGLRESRAGAVDQVMSVFRGANHTDFPYRSALLLTDALAGLTEELIDEITIRTGGTYQLFGGGAGDDARFQDTKVFHGTEICSDAVVVLEMLSKKPVGIGVRHGWEAVGGPFRVTEVNGDRLVSLNAMPAVEAFAAHAAATGQQFDRANPMPFFLHNVLGIDTGQGFKLRVPLALHDDGAVTCAAEIPAGALVSIMSASVASASEAAGEAAKAALAALQGGENAGALLFDCAATRLRLGHEFRDELRAVAQVLGNDNFSGCNTHGQIARTESQFNGFHNCTAVVCAIPR